MNAQFWLARVTVEAAAPIAVGTGAGDSLRDALFATDPHGLPYLPGTSLAGVLRRSLPEDVRWQWFGRVEGGNAERSRVYVSDALIHDSRDRPHSMMAGPSGDPVLAFAAAGITRDHVRLNAAGTAAGRGKFDDSAVPAGCRFTFELRIDGDACVATETDIGRDALLRALWTSLHLGGKTLRGYGHLKVVRLWARSFEMSRREDREHWRKVPRGLEESCDLRSLGFQAGKAPSIGPASPTAVTLKLAACEQLLIGGGVYLPESTLKRLGSSEAKIPLSEPVIEWLGANSQVGSIAPSPRPVVPATAVKGALRHRCEFHLRRLTGDGAGAQISEQMSTLFGATKSDVKTGQPGRVRIGDVRLEASQLDDKKLAVAPHVSIDRFTGGPMPGLLFHDVSMDRPSFALHVEILPGPTNADAGQPTQKARQALVWALRDLVDGRLALGTGRNSGYGFVKGDFKQLEPLRAWLEEVP